MFRALTRFIWILAFCGLGTALAAQDGTTNDIPPYPVKPTASQIYDDNHLLNATETRLFDDLAKELFQKTGIELACVLVNDFKYAAHKENGRDFSSRTADQWQLGAPTGEGVMIFISQKQRWKDIVITPGAQNLFDENDLAKIQQKTLLPALRENNYGEGILSLAYTLAQKAAQAKGVSLEVDGSAYTFSRNSTSSLMILFSLFVFFLVLMAKFSGGRGNGLLWFLFGGAIKNRKKDEPETGFGGGFGNSPRGFGGGFGGGLGGGFSSSIGRGGFGNRFDRGRL